jgi:hypothetical protein
VGKELVLSHFKLADMAEERAKIERLAKLWTHGLPALARSVALAHQSSTTPDELA